MLLACLAASPLWMHSAEAAQINWPEGTLKYVVLNQNLKDVFQRFASHLNVPVSLNKRVSHHEVDGRIPAMHAREFLEWLCKRHSLIWYFDGTVLNIEPTSDYRQRALASHGLSETAVLERLELLDAADSRFTVRSAKDKSRLIVDGPSSFAVQVHRVVSQLAIELAEAQPAKTKDRLSVGEQKTIDPPQEEAQDERSSNFLERVPQSGNELYPALKPEMNSKGSLPRLVTTPTGTYWVREERVRTIKPANGKIQIYQEKLSEKPSSATGTVIERMQQSNKVRVFRGS